MQMTRIASSPKQLAALLRLTFINKNLRIFTTNHSFTQVRLFRHQQKDLDRAAGKPEVKKVEPNKEIPGSQEATIISQDAIPNSRLKQLVSQYGKTAFVVFIVVSLTNLTICYLLVKLGLLGVVIQSESFQNFVEKYPNAQAGGEFLLAYAIHKFAAPLRYFVTASITPGVVALLRKKGLMAKPKFK